MAQSEKKISTVEAILLLMFVGFVDIIQFFLGFLDGGTISSLIINPPVFLITQFYFTMKGIKGLANVAGNLAEFIPILNALPIRTGVMIAIIIIANNPKLAQATTIKPTK